MFGDVGHGHSHSGGDGGHGHSHDGEKEHDGEKGHGHSHGDKGQGEKGKGVASGAQMNITGLCSFDYLVFCLLGLLLIHPFVKSELCVLQQKKTKKLLLWALLVEIYFSNSTPILNISNVIFHLKNPSYGQHSALLYVCG